MLTAIWGFGQYCVRVTVVGQGLAGTVLAWQLLREGGDPEIVDRGDHPTASSVAAGLVTPLTGLRMAASWRISELLPAAREFYSWVGAVLGHEVYREQRIVRIFRNSEECGEFERRMELLEPWVDVPTPGDVPEGIRAPYGFAALRGGGKLDVERFLGLSRERWLREGRFRWGEVVPEPAAERLGPVVYCTGIAAAAEAGFSALSFRPAKGELLTLRIDGLGEGRSWNRSGTWLAPLGDGLFRCGATYTWDWIEAGPTREGRETLEGRLGEFLVLRWEVVEHAAAVRPVIRRSRLVMGTLPGSRHEWVMNGLGSKGVMTAPYFGRQLARSVLWGEALDAEVDLARALAPDRGAPGRETLR